MALGEKVDLEELGGWRLHAEVTGLVDQVVDKEEEVFDAIKRFLSYLPSHHRKRRRMRRCRPARARTWTRCSRSCPRAARRSTT